MRVYFERTLWEVTSREYLEVLLSEFTLRVYFESLLCEFTLGVHFDSLLGESLLGEFTVRDYFEMLLWREFLNKELSETTLRDYFEILPWEFCLAVYLKNLLWASPSSNVFESIVKQQKVSFILSKKLSGRWLATTLMEAVQFQRKTQENWYTWDTS